MIEIPKAGEPQEWGKPDTGTGGRLTWRPVVPHPSKPAWAQSDRALFTCSNGHECRIGAIHTIAEDGTADPSFVCPVSGCSFHDHVRLLGWPHVITG